MSRAGLNSFVDRTFDNPVLDVPEDSSKNNNGNYSEDIRTNLHKFLQGQCHVTVATS